MYSDKGIKHNFPARHKGIPNVLGDPIVEILGY